VKLDLKNTPNNPTKHHKDGLQLAKTVSEALENLGQRIRKRTAFKLPLSLIELRCKETS